MKINKTQNKILIGLAVAALVAIFFYQVTYGMSGTIGPNGTMTVTKGNITGTVKAPPGTKISVSVTPLTPHNFIALAGTTWMFVIGYTSGTITFHNIYTHKFPHITLWPNYIQHFNDHTEKGVYQSSDTIDPVNPVFSYLRLCPGVTAHTAEKWNYEQLQTVPCHMLKFTSISPNHVELKEPNGETLHLMRGDMSNMTIR